MDVGLETLLLHHSAYVRACFISKRTFNITKRWCISKENCIFLFKNCIYLVDVVTNWLNFRKASRYYVVSSKYAISRAYLADVIQSKKNRSLFWITTCLESRHIPWCQYCLQISRRNLFSGKPLIYIYIYIYSRDTQICSPRINHLAFTMIITKPLSAD